MKKSTLAKILLFVTAVLWGSTFTIGKLASEVFSAAFVIALRFLVAALALLIVAYPQRKQLDRKHWIDGFWMGLSLFISYILQVGGLALDTSPGKSAFLCTTYSVLVPFVYWLVTKEPPKLRHVVCVFLCLYLQSYGLKYAEPAIGGMLLSLESVFGVLFSVIVYHETITLRMVIGFAVIFAAIMLSQREDTENAVPALENEKHAP